MTNFKPNRKSIMVALTLIIMASLIVAIPGQAKPTVEKRVGLVKTIEIEPLGQITDAVKDTLEFDTANGEYPNIIYLSGDVYAITYTGDGNDGYLKTVEIATDGEMDMVIDTLEFDTANGEYPNIIHVSDNIYALAYQGKGNDGFLKTVEITPSGQITDKVIDTLEFDPVVATTPNIIPVLGNIFAIAYWGEYGDGFLKTVEIDTSGHITDVVIDTLEFDTVMGWYPNIIQISDEVYAITYAGIYEYGYLKTVGIATTGEIADTVIDTLEFDSTIGTTPNIIHVLDDVYAIAYEGPSGNGFLSTVGIATDGKIADTVIDTLEFDNGNCKFPNIIYVSNDVYAIAYEGPSGNGFLSTVGIATDGDIDTVKATLAFDSTIGTTPNIIHVSDDVYAVAYTQVSKG